MGKHGGGGHTPYEAPDNLKSNQQLSVIDAISEGPIEGPVNGLQSFLINNTPVVDVTGNPNIHGVTIVYRVGEQEQPPLEGFTDSGAEVVVGAEVKNSNPITRTIVSEHIDRLRLTFGVQSLVSYNDQGDRNPSSVNLQIQIQRNGVWITEKDITITGKTTSQYLASVVVDNLPPRPFGIRMVRTTPDSTTDRLQDKTQWSGYTELIDIKQCYPNTAVVGVQVDAEQFGSQQVTRNYHLYGRIVPVPSNYDPKTRTYSGVWDGSFMPAYTNNPAWCVLDVLIHNRYGLGQRIGLVTVDKWSLYAIAQYCDQSVPDGFGGTEPRITCNALLFMQRKFYDVLSDFCLLMRCMPVWNGQEMTFVQDRPTDKVWTYTNSNVVNGEFKYSFSALKDRHNAVEVRYIDPKNGWKTATELVEDHHAIARYGRNLLKIDAFGCTSRGQAHRTGLWVIKTELLETQTVDFSIGAEGVRHVPGDIFEVCDNDYADAQIGGRILAADSHTRTLRLDREIALSDAGKATLTFIGPDGMPVSAEIKSQPHPDQVVVDTLPEGVMVYGVWGLKLPTMKRRLFRCVSIREGDDDGTYAVTGVQHVPEKEAIVDNGASFDPQPGTDISVIPPAVQHLVVDIQTGNGQHQAKARWDTPRVVKDVRFSLRLTASAAAPDNPDHQVTTVTIPETEYAFTSLPLGNYTLTVCALNGFGQKGEPSSVKFSIAAPEAPEYIELTPGYFQITVTPRQRIYHADTQFEFWFSEKRITDVTQIESVAQFLGKGRYWIAASVNIKPGIDYYFYIRSVNVVGKSAYVEAIGQASNDAAGYLDFFKGQITESHLGKELLGKFELSEENASKLTEFAKEWKDANDKWNALWGVKVEQTKDGKHYVAGLGLSMEDSPEGKHSQFLVAADRIAFINPANGNTKPMFVGQDDQIMMNDVFVKRLHAVDITSSGNPPTFSLTAAGCLSARNADISGNINANSGTLNNVTINKDCRILGKLSADNIEGDITKTYLLSPGGTVVIPAVNINRYVSVPTLLAWSSQRTKSTVELYVDDVKVVGLYSSGGGMQAQSWAGFLPAGKSMTMRYVAWSATASGNPPRSYITSLIVLAFKQ